MNGPKVQHRRQFGHDSNFGMRRIRIVPMIWHSLFIASVFVGKAVLVVGVICLLVFGRVSQTQERIAKYKKTGRIVDLLKILSRWCESPWSPGAPI